MSTVENEPLPPFEIGPDLRDKDVCRKYWEDKSRALLRDRVVHEVRYLTPEESSDIGWEGECSLVIQLNDINDKRTPVLVFPARDEEGNGAGVLFTDDSDLSTIPMLREWIR